MGKRQITLFNTFAREKTKEYVIYKKPNNDYECFVERFCLRNKPGTSMMNKKTLTDKANELWREVSKGEGKKERITEFLKLKPGEQPFVR